MPLPSPAPPSLSPGIQASPTVAIIGATNAPAPGAHGLAVLRETLRKKGFVVTAQPSEADYRIVIGGPATAALPARAESLSIWRGAVQGKPEVAIAGSDARGLMYAALDVAERIEAAPKAHPFERIHTVTQSPTIAIRGISMYTMQSAYFEQRLYDEAYWRRYFDMLAADRLNSFVVIFGYENGGFLAPCYPYFFSTTGFPAVEMVGIAPEQQARNVQAFRALIRIAHERGITVTAGIWDHIYRGGVQAGGIPGAAENVGKRVPGLVAGLNADNLMAYTRASLRQFLRVFPEIDALQFRMHDESGLAHSEIVPFWHDVFREIKSDHPSLRIDLRAKELPDAVIDDAVGMGLQATVSTKYWMEQMGLPFHPTHINTENQRDRRHGYADMLRYPQRYKIHWQIWSGGTTRVLLWGDPEYVRRVVPTLRLYGGDSFEINEMLATRMLGETHDTPVKPVLNPAARYFDYEFERYWYFYRLWGRLTYDPDTPADTWTDEFDRRFGPASGPHVLKALTLASRVLPRIVAASYLYSQFPTTRGWAEMNREGGLPEYAAEEGSDIQQFVNVHDEARSLLEKTDTPRRRPEETSRWFAQTADAILAELAQAEQLSGAAPGKEFVSTATDLRILAGLARYHSWRLLGGVSYSLYQQSGSLAAFDDAIADERHAVASWKQMVDAAGDIYSKDLPFGAHAVGFSRHWSEEYGLLTRDFDKLLTERAAATPPTAQDTHPTPLASLPEPPTATLSSAALAEPGKDFRVTATVAAPGGVKSVRLRYRHLTQFEDYQTAEMAKDSQSGDYVGQIPASFIDPTWDVMYFVEVVGANGASRQFPDLEKETPYVVVPVKR